MSLFQTLKISNEPHFRFSCGSGARSRFQSAPSLSRISSDVSAILISPCWSPGGPSSAGLSFRSSGNASEMLAEISYSVEQDVAPGREELPAISEGHGRTSTRDASSGHSPCVHDLFALRAMPRDLV